MIGTYVTAAGLDIPSVQDLIGNFEASQRANIAADLNTEADDVFGQMNGIVASHLRRAWEVLEIAYNADDTDKAEDVLLDAVCAITGTTRNPATRSKFVNSNKVIMTLALNTPVPINTVFHVAGDPSVSFHTTETIVGTSAGSYAVACECDVTGPVVCNAGTLTVIATPVTGLLAVTNPGDVDVGALADNDAMLRLRREEELRATGSATVDAIRSDLLAVRLADKSAPIAEADVLQNTGDVIDGNGVPGHGLECIIYDGIGADCPDTTVAQTIWDSAGGGIALTGGISANATDSEGVTRSIPFSRCTVREIVLEATLTLSDVTQIPSDYLAAVQQAVITEFAKRRKRGAVIRCTHYSAVIVEIPGIEDCTIRIGYLSVGLLATGTNLPLALREIGFIQTTGITVV